ncbi:hypothetical protein PHET_05346 [Paragonimus heterotremus]|uniref:Protein kinase domain-containing protein n=1 Tax=Paragonimus heterotremus TaxID=100268 RepID=A0A8J4WGT2_9TREM|nr:hypothetical protein PHET_05346 [Paragonimus heterotremus]
MFKGTVGTPPYLAPECVKEPGEPYLGKPVDIWAVGMTLYWMIHRQNYFEGVDKYDIFEQIRTKPIVLPSDEMTMKFQHILNLIFGKDPVKRITAAGLKQMTKDWNNETNN